MESKTCLGIEATANTFGVGIVSSDGKILSNVKDIYTPPAGYGIKPIEAKWHHEKVKEKILEDALMNSGLKIEDINMVAFSQGPGLPPCLNAGLDFAKKISLETGKPVVGVNHCIAHIEIGRLATGCKDPVVLYVSGGNTQVLSFVEGKYRCFGETQDIGIGNAIDKLGREMGLDFPEGPKVEELAKTGKYSELPYVVKGMDTSFSGIVTECINRFRKDAAKEDICFSFQETCFAMLVEITERALAHTGKTEVLLTGGVAANKRLQEMLGIMCAERGGSFFGCPMAYAGDNGEMIEWTGVLMHGARC